MNASQEADWLDQPTPLPHPDAAALLARIDAGKVPMVDGTTTVPAGDVLTIPILERVR